jgi:hypothetical protein
MLQQRVLFNEAACIRDEGNEKVEQLRGERNGNAVALQGTAGDVEHEGTESRRSSSSRFHSRVC